MDELRKKFGSRLKTLRRQSGLTQEQLAEAVGISVDFVSLVERGINAPSFDNLERIARALEVPIQRLFDFYEAEQM